ncbi:hypothetical protein QBC41DRAFT_320425 [Cercophora samala]|uniref:Uncharacterized protein n=1 Tax=Cercophora samala TaxID=330535 RepID=A0AA39ZDX8_9PEZI|nr:hypothetical protein QBC41DRAFT_320425 [Cercophora samala]
MMFLVPLSLNRSPRSCNLSVENTSSCTSTVGSRNDIDLTVLETLSLALTFGTMEEDQPSGKYGRQPTLEVLQRSFAAYILEYNKLWHDMLKTNDKDVLPSHSLYDGLSIETQTELRRRAQGTTSEGFLQYMTWQAMCRVVYRTMSGHVGIGSRISLPGDLVCRVRGSPILMTLRRAQDSEFGDGMRMDTVADVEMDYYAYIGPTIVPARQQKDSADCEEDNEQAVRSRIL